MLAIDQRMRELLQTPGIRSVCLVDWCSGRALSCVGIDEADEVPGTAAILQAINGGPLCASQGLRPDAPPVATQSIEDVVVTEEHDHLLFAVLRGTEFCVQVRLSRDRGSLGFALRQLRDLADDVEFPPGRGNDRSHQGNEHPTHGDEPPGQGSLPPRRGGGSRTRPRPRPRVSVERPVLERVLTALRSLAVARVGTGPVVV